MEVLTESNSAVSHRRTLKLVKYDSPAFREQSSSEKKPKRALREQYNIQFSRNTAPSSVVFPSDGEVDAYGGAHEMVNVCYAKIWRGSRMENICEDIEDSEMEKAFPMYLEKDLDKLQKLRLKSKFKSRKCLDNDEVKAWIEKPGKFIDLLKQLRGDKVENGTEKSDGEFVKSCTADDQSRPSHAVHFPQHVLLCAALQEGDSSEIERVIKNNSIDLNTLIQATNNYYLHKTVLNDQLECAKMLIRYGVDVNTKDNEGVSPLALAFRLMNLPMVVLLVHSGADVGEYTNSRIEEMDKVKELSCSVSKVFEMDV